MTAAAFLRFYGIGWLPPGLFNDEAAIGLDALDILRTGVWPIYFERTTGGQEPLFGYLTTLAFMVLGPNDVAMRVVAPVLGILTVGVTYLLARELLGRWAGLIASILIGVSYWHVHVSHTSFRAISLPFLMGLAILTLWRALKRDGEGPYVLAGIAAGVTTYTYQSSRVFPLFLALLLAYVWLCRGRKLPWKGVGVFLGVMALVSAPLLAYYAGHPEMFSARIQQVGTGGMGLGESLGNALGMFSYRGDITWKFNLPGKPVFDPVVSAFFYFGLLVCLWRWRQPAYGLLLLWNAVMLLPTALSTESPHFLRALGIMPAVYIVPVVGVLCLADLIRTRFRTLTVARGVAIAYGGLAVWLAVGGILTYRDYFGEWAVNARAYEVYDGDVEAASRYLNTLEGSEVVMFSAQFHGHYTVLFFERRDLDLRWFDARQSLPLPDERGRDVVYLFPASSMASREFLDTVLGTESLAAEGRGPQGQLSFLAYRLSPERLAQARLRLAPARPLAARLGDELDLVGYRVGAATDGRRAEVAPGGVLPLTLYWKVLARTGSDYSFFTHLVDREGRMWGQGDANKYWSSEWRPGDLVAGRYDLRVDGQAPAGRHVLEVGVFERGSMRRLAVSGGGDSRIIEAVKVTQKPAPAGGTVGQSAGILFGGSIELSSYGLEDLTGASKANMAVRAGDSLRVRLDWRARRPVAEDYTVFLHVLDETGTLVAQADSQPHGGGFPTSFWDEGESVIDRLVVQVPVGARPGRYTLAGGLYVLESGKRLASSNGEEIAVLGYIEVAP